MVSGQWAVGSGHRRCGRRTQLLRRVRLDAGAENIRLGWLAQRPAAPRHLSPMSSPGLSGGSRHRVHGTQCLIVAHHLAPVIPSRTRDPRDKPGDDSLRGWALQRSAADVAGGERRHALPGSERLDVEHAPWFELRRAVPSRQTKNPRAGGRLPVVELPAPKQDSAQSKIHTGAGALEQLSLA